MLGLNTCWVAMTCSKGVTKKKCTIAAGQKLGCVLALGYGTTQGVAHISKPVEQLYSLSGSMPEWCKNGMEAALLAPTAMNQQQFLITLTDNHVCAKY